MPLVVERTSPPSKGNPLSDASVMAMLASVDAVTSHTPSVTVLTNIAGAVSVDRAGIDAGLRLRSAPLPENRFSGLRAWPNIQRMSPPTDETLGALPRNRGAAAEQTHQLPSSSAAAAAVRAEGIKDGIRDALNRWALQTSRRDSNALWRHECSRYASSSRIGYHPNHPSGRHPGSRPSSATTILLPFSATQGEQKQQRANSAVTSSSLPLTDEQTKYADDRDTGLERVGGRVGARPSSAVPCLGNASHAVDGDGVSVTPHSRRGFSASGRGGGTTTAGSRGRGRVLGDKSGRRESPTRSSLQQEETSFEDEGGAVYDDIYEDLDDEDDGELDNRISIMENRFSTAGRERPTSAVGLDGGAVPIGDAVGVQRRIQGLTVPRSARRPPRVPPQASHIAAADAPTRTGGVRKTGESRAARVIKTRPLSAPADGSLFYTRGCSDPMAALHARRIRLALSSAGSENYHSAVGGQGVGLETGTRQSQRESPAVRDVTTAVLSWDRHRDGGNRPVSSATTELATGSDAVDTPPIPGGPNRSRPSSAAFRRWMEARPSARSAISAVSSARTLGLDDPELLHLQVEMESRRGGMSESTLARMEQHYNAVVQKNDPVRPHQLGRSKRGRPTSPRKVSAGAKSPRKGSSTGSGSKKSPRAKAPSSGRSSTPSKGKVTKKKKKGSTRRRKSPSKSRGRDNPALTPRRVYSSARAFIAEHFPSEERQAVSVLGLEQEQECLYASDALLRAGVSVSRETLRRALVIPTDRPLEACLAGLPLPMEGLRDKPFPLPPVPPVATARTTPPSPSGVTPAETTTGALTDGRMAWEAIPGGEKPRLQASPKRPKRPKSPAGKNGRKAIDGAVRGDRKKAVVAKGRRR